MKVRRLNLYRITKHERLRFNLKNSCKFLKNHSDFLSSHITLNFNPTCMIILSKFNSLTLMFSLIRYVLSIYIYI